MVAESLGETLRVAFSVSATDAIAYRMGETSPRQLTWFDRSGKALGTLGEPDGADLMERGAFARRQQSGGSAHGREQHGHLARRFEPDRPASHSNRASSCTQPGRLTELESRSHQRGDRRAVSSKEPRAAPAVTNCSPHIRRLKFPTDWSADGRFLMYFEIETKAQPDLWVLPMNGERKPFLFLGTGSSETWGQFSPDGDGSRTSPTNRAGSRSTCDHFPARVDSGRVSTSGGVYPRWSRDGKELFYLAPDGRLMATSSTVKGVGVEAGTPVELFQPRIAGGGAFLVGGRQEYDVAHRRPVPDERREQHPRRRPSRWC